MLISIVASGSRGDVQPYVALGKGLKQAGYNVRILTSEDFDSLVTSAGLEFRSTGSSIEEMLQTPEWRNTTESGNFLAILSRMTGEMKRRAHELALNIQTLYEGTDLILTGMAGMGGAFSIAEKLNIPVIQAYVFPFTPTRSLPSPVVPNLSLGGTLNRISFHITRQMLWQSVRIADSSTRRELGMPAASFWGPFRTLKQKQSPVLYGFSQYVLPRPEDWDEHQTVTGYWFLDAADDWQPPSDLVEFLAAGKPPVYIGFGSMSNRSPEETTDIILKSLQRSGQRGVLASGWGGLSKSDLPETVYMIKAAPHSWLFPRMAAVVHHGGAGTTAAGLCSGVPSIVVPFFGDQPFWGQRVNKLGVGPAPIPRRKLTVDRLTQAITQSLSDSAMQRRAAELGAKIRDEDGIAQAVALVQQHVK
ncbi:MAG: glycosyltransferase [Anaerolineae bacterium]